MNIPPLAELGLSSAIIIIIFALFWSKSEKLRLDRRLHLAANILGALFSLTLTARSLWSFKVWHNYADILYALTTAIEAALYLIRRYPTDFKPRVTETTICLFAAWGVLFVSFKPGVVVTPLIGIAFMATGLFIQLVAKIYLGRSYALFAANRGIVTGGPYKIVRHPIYLAYLFIAIGFLLGHLCLYNIIIYLVVFTLQIWRILNEERLLSASEDYRTFKEHTRYRILPFIW